jgi:hypothetical protein
VQNAQGNEVEQFEPGLIAYARRGKDVKFNQPSSTAGICEWNRVQMHLVTSGFRVPYALMTGDLSQYNFSSLRVDLNGIRRMVEQLRWQTIIPMFCEPIATCGSHWPAARRSPTGNQHTSREGQTPAPRAAASRFFAARPRRPPPPHWGGFGRSVPEAYRCR